LVIVQNKKKIAFFTFNQISVLSRTGITDSQSQLHLYHFIACYMFRLLWKAIIRQLKIHTNKNNLNTTHYNATFLTAGVSFLQLELHNFYDLYNFCKVGISAVRKSKLPMGFI